MVGDVEVMNGDMGRNLRVKEVVEKGEVPSEMSQSEATNAGTPKRKKSVTFAEAEEIRYFVSERRGMSIGSFRSTLDTLEFSLPTIELPSFETADMFSQRSLAFLEQVRSEYNEIVREASGEYEELTKELSAGVREKISNVTGFMS